MIQSTRTVQRLMAANRMTVVFIKVECPHHPGCWTMGGPCDVCIEEQASRNLKINLDQITKTLKEAING